MQGLVAFYVGRHRLPCDAAVGIASPALQKENTVPDDKQSTRRIMCFSEA